MAGRRRLRALLWSALFTTFSVSLAVVISLQLLTIGFVDGYRLNLTLAEATGLTKGSPVKLSGIEVGQVDSVRLDMGKVKIALTVRDGTRLPADSEVAIRFRSLVGLRQVVVFPGTSKAAAARRGPYHPGPPGPRRAAADGPVRPDHSRGGPAVV